MKSQVNTNVLLTKHKVSLQYNYLICNRRSHKGIVRPDYIGQKVALAEEREENKERERQDWQVDSCLCFLKIGACS